MGSPSAFIRSVAAGSLNDKNKKIPIAPLASISETSENAEISDLVKDVKKKIRRNSIRGR